MQTITSEELKARLDAGEKVNIIDVREPHEHADFNIGGTLYPLGQVQTMQVDELEKFKDEELIVYCRSGNSKIAAADLHTRCGINLSSWGDIQGFCIITK